MSDIVWASVHRVSDVLGIGGRQIQNLARDGILPKAERGKYDLEGCARSYIEYLKKNAGPGAGDGEINFHVEKARKMKYQADLAALEVAKKQGLVTTIDTVEKMVTKAFAEVRAGMRNIPGRTVSLLIGETDERRFKRVLLEEIDTVLETLANAELPEDDEELSEDDEDDDADDE